jgi:hypothetical protein
MSSTELTTDLDMESEAGEEGARLTNGENIPLPTDHLIRLGRDEKVVPYICQTVD